MNRLTQPARCLLVSGLRLWVLMAVLACAHTTPRATGPVRWVDADRQPIAKPKPLDEYRTWDFLDHNLFYPVEKLLDLDWTGRRLGETIGLGPGHPADNVNALDETVNSSWFTNRHFLHPMTIEELVTGPGVAQPDTSGLWEVVSGKFYGVSAGFTVKDPKGQTFVLKFDTKRWPEMASSAEVISTKILHAAGYNVPENSVVTFPPSRLTLGPKARVRNADGSRRPMTVSDIDSIFAKVSVQADGRGRALSSAFLPGEPLGPFTFHGVRGDDPNDRVEHEHRRELRGLRVISSWLNDADRRTANTLDMFVRSPAGTGYVKHYLIDMGSTIGSNSRIPHLPRYGEAYLLSPRHVMKKILGLGFASEPWETPAEITHPTIGYFSNDRFRAGHWVTAYPNPAFQWCGNGDGYWGAKIVMSFTDEQVAAIVRTGKLSDAEAEAELTRLLIERRDMIGRYWFARSCPLDRFRVEGDRLHFDDLGIAGNLDRPDDVTYRVALAGVPLREGSTKGRVVALPDASSGANAVVEITRKVTGGDESRITVWLAQREGVWEVVRLRRET